MAGIVGNQFIGPYLFPSMVGGMRRLRVIVGLTSGTWGSAPVSCSRLCLITTGVLLAFNTGAANTQYASMKIRMRRKQD